MQVAQALETAGIERLDAEVLLANALGKAREWVLAHPEADVDEVKWREVLSRRKHGEPLSYITGQKEFYGREFIVDPRVLIPRPATEGLIDLALETLVNPADRVVSLDTEVSGVARIFGDLSDVSLFVDLGTGSGCIALTIALETGFNGIATDISQETLHVASLNAKKHGVILDFRLGDGLAPIADLSVPFVLVSNPPYVPESEVLDKEVADFEPHIALRGGSDGSDLVINIINGAKMHPFCRGVVIECKDSHVHLFE